MHGVSLGRGDEFADLLQAVRREPAVTASALHGEERLEVLLHELVHAAGWHIDEAFVERFASDAARALWRLGYRDQGMEPQ